MLFHRSLNEVFRSWTHIAVLRALQDTAVGSTGNQVARDAQMHPRSAFKALTALEVLGIVNRRRGGRDHLFTLNRDHILLESGILPMLDVERRMIERLEAELQRLLRRRVIAAILFGSVARHEEKPESDVDLCCIVDGERSKGMAQDALHASAPVIYRRFGAKLAPIFFTTAEFQRKRTSPLVKTILAEGRVIVGRMPGAPNHG
jgi:DNA-binding transcriptional ArsR family regulator